MTELTRYSAEKILRAEFISNFDQTIPVCFENRDNFWLCTNPLTASDKPSDDIWVRFYFVNNTSNQRTYASKGNRTWNRMGLIGFQVNYPQGKGVSTPKELCEDIINIFEGNTFNSVYCLDGTYQEQGIQDDGFYMLYGTIDYNFDVRK